MNREIKFRQPITEKGKFIGWHCWGYIGNNLGFFTSPLSSNDGKIKSSYQFIGLLDKNGKEIYEADQVIHPQYPTPLVVRWDYDQWGLFDGICNEASIDETVEIIGNIYEQKIQDNN